MRHYRPRELVDLGCGSGGLGIWLATQLGCHHYIGIDAAAPFAPTSSGSPRVTFLKQRFEALELAGLGADAGIVSHDALYLARDPASV